MIGTVVRKEGKKMGVLKDLAEQSRKDAVEGIAALTLIVVFFIFASYLAQVFEQDIEAVIGANSALGMAAFVLVFVLSVIFTPISVLPLVPVGAQLWGVFAAASLSIVGWALGAMAAFGIARRFGRPYVSKFVSLKKIERIERFMPRQNVFWAIFFFRAVSPFDGLSYALGLFTQVSFRTFFWATVLGLIPFCLAVAYLGSLPPVFLATGLVIAGLFCIAGIIGIKKRKERKPGIIGNLKKK